MSRRAGTAITVASLGVLAVAALAGCGRQGSLEQPAPLFGERTKAEYRARQAAEAAAADQRSEARRNRTPAAADQPDPTDNAPITKRDIQDPAQKLEPLSSQPLDGTIPDPRGAPISTTPPN